MEQDTVFSREIWQGGMRLAFLVRQTQEAGSCTTPRSGQAGTSGCWRYRLLSSELSFVIGFSANNRRDCESAANAALLSLQDGLFRSRLPAPPRQDLASPITRFQRNQSKPCAHVPPCPITARCLVHGGHDPPCGLPLVLRRPHQVAIRHEPSAGVSTVLTSRSIHMPREKWGAPVTGSARKHSSP